MRILATALLLTAGSLTACSGTSVGTGTDPAGDTTSSSGGLEAGTATKDASPPTADSEYD